MAYTYKLEGDKVVPCNDLREWASWYFEEKDRLTIARDEVRNNMGSIKAVIETRFVGQTDMGEQPPRVWQTRCENGKELGRTVTRKEAEAYHARMVKMFERMFSK